MARNTPQNAVFSGNSSRAWAQARAFDAARAYIPPMKRAAAILATIALALSLAPAFAEEKLSLEQLSRYLNSLTAIKSAFTQISDDGSPAAGMIYIQRPGRARFEYDPPSDALVMAGGGQVAIFDEKSNLPPQQYPLRLTPLNLILKGDINLSQAEMVVGHDFDGTATSVTAQDPDNPEHGSIRLFFTGPPIELRGWVVASADGSETTVILDGLERASGLKASLFSIQGEIRRRGH